MSWAPGLDVVDAWFEQISGHVAEELPWVRPLASHDVIVNTIAATTTSTGLTVHAELDTNEYPSGVKISDKQMKALDASGALIRHRWHGEWNCTLAPENARVES